LQKQSPLTANLNAYLKKAVAIKEASFTHNPVEIEFYVNLFFAKLLK
jgi:hypothetical protein